jgi:hypothetical protein
VHKTRKTKRISKKPRKRNVIKSSSSEDESENKSIKSKKRNAKRVKSESVSSCFKKETLRPRNKKINYKDVDGDDDNDEEAEDD